jgi:uncharacterized protein YecT (DUF1311 family)
VNQNLLPGTIRAAQCAVLLIALVIAPIHAQAAPLTEKIRDTSPDGKFAMRITYDAEVNDQMIKAEMADAGLNKTYETLLTKLPDAEGKEKLKESQRGWLAFRDAEAAFAADQARGGSMAPTIRYETMAALT